MQRDAGHQSVARQHLVGLLCGAVLLTGLSIVAWSERSDAKSIRGDMPVPEMKAEKKPEPIEVKIPAPAEPEPESVFGGVREQLRQHGPVCHKIKKAEAELFLLKKGSRACMARERRQGPDGVKAPKFKLVKGAEPGLPTPRSQEGKPGKNSGSVKPAAFAPRVTDNGNGTFLSPNWRKEQLVPVDQYATTPDSAWMAWAEMAYDPERKEALLFGGLDENRNVVNQTWVWNAGLQKWQNKTPTVRPPGRYLHSMAWDESLQAIVVYGGRGANDYPLADAWKWTGSAWQQLNPTGTAPSGRWGSGMAYDPDRGGLVIFGGRNVNAGEYRNDTWLLKNNAWSVIQADNAVGAPAPRAEPVLGYSESTSQLVLFSGGTGTCPEDCVTFDDTWVLGKTASSWTKKAKPVTSSPDPGSPVKRRGAAMAYVPAMGGLVMFGGLSASSTTTTTYHNDTWAWNGERWLKAGGVITSPQGMWTQAVSAIPTGGMVMYGVTKDSEGTNNWAEQTWTYDPNMPIVELDVTGATGPDGIFYTGDAATVKVKLTNVGLNAITTSNALNLISALDERLLAPGTNFSWGGNPLAKCAGTGTATCGLVEALTARVSNLTLPAGASSTVEFALTVVGLTRGCSVVNVPVMLSNLLGGSMPVSRQITVCGGGLGLEDWWSYDTTDLGGGGRAHVNVANGNLVVDQIDAPPIQAHGRLAFSLGRVYNSQANMNGGGPLGAGWQFNLGETGEAAGGIGVAGLKLPSAQSLTQPLSMTYVDRDGTHHTFRLRAIAATVGDWMLPIDLSDGAGSAGSSVLKLLNPATLPWNPKEPPTDDNPLNYDSLCIDEAYSAPAGTDMFLFRYIGVGENGCGNPSADGVVQLGWSAVRPDRVRYDFDLLGRLIRVTDQAGNVMVYDQQVTHGPTEIYGKACTPTDGAACPRMTINYDAGAVSATRREVRVTDPAGRVTTYVVSKGPIPQLLEVWDPGNPVTTDPAAKPSASYTYSTGPIATNKCGGSATSATSIGMLCSVTDAKGHKTTFAYKGAPVGRDRVLAVSDRRANASAGTESGPDRGLRTLYTYTDRAQGGSEETGEVATQVPSLVTADMEAPSKFTAEGCPTCKRVRYSQIDDHGRVEVIEEGTASDTYSTQTGYFWDGGKIETCRQPGGGMDHNLCQVITRGVPRANEAFVRDQVKSTISGEVSVPDQGTDYLYGELGQLLRTKVYNGKGADAWTDATSSITTYGSHDQYIDANGKVRAYDNAVGGDGEVKSTSAPGNYAATVKADTPAAYYRLGEPVAEAKLNDASGNERNGDYLPGANRGQDGKVTGNSAVGEATNSTWSATAPGFGFAAGTGTATALTLEAWMKTSTTTAEVLVNHGSGNQFVRLGRFSGGRPQLALASDFGAGKLINVVSNNSIADDAWHHVAATYTGSGTAAGVKIYIDGVASAVTVYSDTLSGAFSPATGGALHLGWNPAGGISTMDEVALYPRVLAVTELESHRRAAAGASRVEAGTLFAVTDQTQELSARGNSLNPAINWVDYLNLTRRDVPAPGEDGAGTTPFAAADNACKDNVASNTGLACKVHTPASAGVSAGDCGSVKDGAAPQTSMPDPTPGVTHACVTYTYDKFGQRTTMRSAKAHAEDDPAVTRYTYYPDTHDCAAEGAQCDLSDKVSAGGWLKAVTDPAGDSVVHAYDRAGNRARTWSRNATQGFTLDADWTNRASPPSVEFSEEAFANPVTSASLSVTHSATIVANPNGTVSGSGSNASGELGDGSTTARSTPVQMKLGTNVVQVAQSGLGEGTCKQTFTLTGAGKVWRTGSGIGTGATTSTPVQLPGLSGIISIAAGGCHLVALNDEGKVWTWGLNSVGQWGNGTLGGDTGTGTGAAAVQSLSGVASIGAGANHSLAVKTDGTLWAWGWNSAGQLGLGDKTNRSTPTQVPDLKDVIAVHGGYLASYAITTDGRVWAWGDNTYGALGIGSTAEKTTPTRIAALGPGSVAGKVRHLAAGAYGAAALTGSGEAWAWGLNNFGQLGTTGTTATAPVRVPGLTDQVALAGSWATYATANEAGKVTIWGATGNHQLGTGANPTTSPPTPSGYDISPHQAPWRYSLGSRDPTGRLTTRTVNSSGEVRANRPGRGHAVVTSAYDQTQGYDADNHPIWSLTPMARPGVKKAETSYDPHGNAVWTTDPRGLARFHAFDAANRPLYTQFTRDTEAGSAGSNCTGTAASSSGWPAAQVGHKLCLTMTTSDGAGRLRSSYDANGQTTWFGYDGAGRRILALTPRNDGVYTRVTTAWAYDLDGHVARECSPREYDTAESDAAAACNLATLKYSTHFTWDRAGRSRETSRFRIPADGGTAEKLTTTTSYDADGNAVAIKDPNGRSTTATYDLRARRLTQTVPRAAGVSHTTKWRYDDSGNVTSVIAPGSQSLGSGAGGTLVVDGTTASASSDGQLHNRTNPFAVPDGASYRKVVLQNGGWITGANPHGLVFTATDDVTVCATCGMDMAGKGYTGGLGAKAGLGNATGNDAANPVSADGTTGGNGGRGGKGVFSGAAGGGGGGGHKVAGTTADGPADSVGAGPRGVGGRASGESDFAKVGSDYLLGSGGGGGGGGQGFSTSPAGDGAAGGGFIRITASNITVDGQIDAAGKSGGNATGPNGGGGGGAGGGIWLAADAITLAPSALKVGGGTGGTAISGKPGGAGAPGRVRLDGDTIAGAPSDADTTRAANITAYSYDAANRPIDVLAGAQTLEADPAWDSSTAALPDEDGLANTRTRTVYDAEGRPVASFPPDAFTDAASLLNPSPDTARRVDVDLDGRVTATFSPRYTNATGGPNDPGDGNDAGTGINQQSSQCPTGPATQLIDGLPSYSTNVGVCVTRTAYDAAGLVTTQWLPTATVPTGIKAARKLTYTYTDDGLVAKVSGPDPTAAHNADAPQVAVATTLYDGVGRPVKQTDALLNSSTTAYTSDGLVSRTEAQRYTPAGGAEVTHVTTYGYNAAGQQTKVTDPRGNALNGVAANFTTTTVWTSDGQKAQVQAPGKTAGEFNTTKYGYDANSNPTTVTAPNQVAASSTVSTVNTFTHDNLVASTSVPRNATGSEWRTTRYAYTPSGQKSSAAVGRCTSTDLAACVPGNAAWNAGGTTRFTYGPNGLPTDQIGKNDNAITTTYDRAGRTKTISDPASGITVTAGYYLDGNLRRVADEHVASTYAWDASGHLTSRTDLTPTGSPFEALTNNQVKRTSYAYNDAGLPTAVSSDATGITSGTMAYDEAGRLTATTDKAGTGTTRTSNFNYHQDDTLDTLTSSAGGSQVASYTYRYDPAGNITKQTVTGTMAGADPSRTEEYEYNPAGNLTKWTHTTAGPGTPTNYTWDRNNNRLTASSGSVTATWGYRPDNSISSQQLRDTTKTPPDRPSRSFEYDNAGRLTNDACSNYTYDDFDRTKSVTNNGAHESCDTGPLKGTTTTYAYDGLDRNRTTSIAGASPGNEGFNGSSRSIYDGLTSTVVGQVGAETPEQNRADLLYQLAASGRQHALTQAGGPTDGNGTHLLENDGQGNTTGLLTASGSRSCAASYDPFGSPLGAVDPEGVCSAGTAAAATANTSWYRGHSRDASTGSYQLGTRTYDPSNGTFTTPDSYRLSTPATDLSVGVDPLTANTYSYVNGDPVNAWDPDGHLPCVRKLWGGKCKKKDESFWGAIANDLKGMYAAVEQRATAQRAEFSANPAGSVLGKVLDVAYPWRGLVSNPTGVVDGLIGPTADALAREDWDAALGHGASALLLGFITKGTSNLARRAPATSRTPVKPQSGRPPRSSPSPKTQTPDSGSRTDGRRPSNAESTGPVVFKDPVAGATPAQVAQIRAYAAACDAALCASALSPTGRTSTSGRLRIEANATAAAEKVKNPGAYGAGQHVGHVPDTTWTGNAVPYSWMALDGSINSSLGSQARRYPIGYQPTGFWYIDDYLAEFGEAP